MISRRGILAALVLASLVLVQAVVVAPAWAQDDIQDEDFFAELANRYVSARLGIHGKLVNLDTDEEFMIAGRWAVVDMRNENAPLVYLGDYAPAGLNGYWKVKVGDQIVMIGDEATGGWLKVPTAYHEPRDGLGVGKTGGFIYGEWATNIGGETEGDSGGVISVGIKMSLVRNLVRFEITLMNRTDTVRSMGLQMTGNAVVGGFPGGVNSGEFPWISNIGCSKSAGSIDIGRYDTLLSGRNVPDYFDIFDSFEAPTFSARNWLRTQDSTVPDYIAIGDFDEITPVSVWIPTDYEPDILGQIDDLAWALCWNQQSVSPRNSRTIVTYYGTGAASSIWSYNEYGRVVLDHAVLATESPRTLKYDSSDSTSTVDLRPASFPVKAWVYNLATDSGPYTLQDVSMTIHPGPGLKLADAQTARQTVGTVPLNTESQPVEWTLEATGDRCGELRYFISAVDSVTGWQQVVERTIMVPATKRGTFRSGWQLMHVPFQFNNNTFSHVFPSLTLSNYYALYYDSAIRQYVPISQVVPGKSYWLYVTGISSDQPEPFELPDDAYIVGAVGGSQSQEFLVPLRPGWNMIGNPLVYPVYWGQALVYNPSKNVTVSLQEAAAKRWINITLFSWNSDKGAYDVLTDSDELLNPWTGYWIKAYTPVELIFRPAVYPEWGVNAPSVNY